MQGIWTKYLPATSSRGSRIKAIARVKDDFGAEMSLTLSYNHALTAQENHTAAASALASELGWVGMWHCGGRPDGAGFMYVNCAHAYAGAPVTSVGLEGRDWFYIESTWEDAK